MATIVTDARPVFSWSAVFAGTLAAMAVSLLLLSLGTGIGLKLASPYSFSPSATALGIGAAVWIILAQMWGYAVGGYVAGRLGSRWSESEPESNFLDGAHGFVVWALGVFLTGLLVAMLGLFAAGSVAGLGAGALAARSAVPSSVSAVDTTGYFVDSIFRMEGPQRAPTGPLTTAPAATPPAGPAAQVTTPQGETPPTMMAIAPQTPASSDLRAEVGRIFNSGVRDGRLSDTDRNYLGRIVSERTGIASELASGRVQDAERRALAAAKEAADRASKAGAFASFWTFMALMLGAVSATLAGVFGGNQRDEWALRRVGNFEPAPRARRGT
jgi:hypothetical protein